MASNLRERFIITRLYKDERKVKVLFLIILGLVFVLIANIAYLNFVSFNDLKASYMGNKVDAPTPTPAMAVEEEVIITPVLQQTEIYKDGNRNQGPKEYFIALGTGSVSSNDWVDVPGVEAVIDFGNYQNVKEIKLEVSISVPTANQSVSVRLFNKTDGHPVWNSEVVMDGGAASYLVSPALNYDLGSKTYIVQMKTQLKHQANLTQSRLHIVLE